MGVILKEDAFSVDDLDHDYEISFVFSASDQM